MKQRLKVGSFILAIIILLGLILTSAYDFVGLNPTPQPNPATLLGNEDIPPPPPLDPQLVTARVSRIGKSPMTMAALSLPLTISADIPGTMMMNCCWRL
jgi:hypothetical protein